MVNLFMIEKKKSVMRKIRIDRLLVERTMAGSRERAQAMIFAGHVLVNGQKVDKAGALVPENSNIRILGERLPFVGRGGLKLEHALTEFHIAVKDKSAIDIGASTGGFTDCLLQHGCKKVYAVDVGYGQLAWKLRMDSRVVVIERTNIRNMDVSLIPEQVDMAVMDVSFISLEKVIPSLLKFLGPDSELVALIKPQFEVGKGQIGKGGIVRDEAARTSVVERITDFVRGLGFEIKGVIPSPITGQDGNVEFLLYCRRSW
jgi:23S rRNA (cytidine1920-2'-O)/16S rRNA (cytidine1409-2'-O)-methyltransferase